MIDAETLKRVLDRAGHRVTAPRLRVIEALAGAADHFSSEDLRLAVPGVGRATIFRTLNLLLELDIICQIVIDDGTFAYRVSAEGHHHHLICRDCAEVTDFHVEELEDLLQRLQLQNTFQMESHRLEVYGRCARCVKKSPKPGLPTAVGQRDRWAQRRGSSDRVQAGALYSFRRVEDRVTRQRLGA